MKKCITVPISKTSDEQREATGVVYVPLVKDSQGDFMIAPDIKSSQQRHMRDGLTRNVDRNHDGRFIDGFIAESMISKGDDGFPAGSWVITMKVNDDKAWREVRAGELTGFSLLGRGERVPAMLKGEKVHQIKGLEVEAISLVKRAANQEKFSMVKSADSGIAGIAKAFEQITAQIQATTEAVKDGFQRQQAQIDALEVRSGGVVRKDQPTVDTKTQGKITRKLRKLARLQDRYESVIDRPDLYPDDSEVELRKSITKTQDQLYELGYSGNPAGLDDAGRSAFVHRGGRSDFLQASVSSVPDILGLSHHSRQITKADQDEIDLNRIYL